MAEAESILESLYEAEEGRDYVDGDSDDVEMIDAEEMVIDDGGEEVLPPCQKPAMEVGGRGEGFKDFKNEFSGGENKRNAKKRRNRKSRKKRNETGDIKITDINRFVLNTCRHLKEKKSYLIWNAVGCLGVSTLTDLVKEVDAIQTCGGQQTTDGKRLRSGGGILWNILKAREPKAYKEIMEKGKEFEKQFRKCKTRKLTERNEAPAPTHEPINDGVADKVEVEQAIEDKHEISDGNRVSALKRIRVPVAYDDLFEEDTGHIFKQPSSWIERMVHGLQSNRIPTEYG